MDSRVSIILTPAEIASLEAAITTIKGIVIPKLVNLSKESRQADRKMGLKNTGYVNGIYEILDANSGIVPATFQMPKFKADRDTGVVLSGLKKSFETITELVSDSEMVMGHQNMIDADAGLELIKSEAKHNATIKTSLDDFLSGHKSPRTDHPLITVPKSSSVTTKNVTKGTRFTNRGTTVFTVFKDPLTIGGIDVGPGDSIVIADGWNTIRIVNNSGTSDGAYTLV